MITDFILSSIIKISEPFVYKGGSLVSSNKERERIHKHNAKVISDNNKLMAERKERELEKKDD